MRGVLVDTEGNLVIKELPKPEPKAGELLVRVQACALNRADLLQRLGKHPPPAGVTPVLGLELSGMVVARGAEVTQFEEGEKVFGLVSGGAYADYCVLDASCAIPMPASFNFFEAAAIPEAFLTAQEALFTLGQLQAGETVLIHAGGSGVGSAAIQMAKAIGAMVVTTCSANKVDKVKTFGPDAVIDYQNTVLKNEVLRITDGKGVNVILDFTGASNLATHLELLQKQGRLIIVGLMGGSKVEIDLQLIQRKRLQLKGLAMRSQSTEEKAIITQRFIHDWLPLLANGTLHPVIDKVFAFKDVLFAHDYMKKNLNIGKIILDLNVS